MSWAIPAGQRSWCGRCLPPLIKFACSLFGLKFICLSRTCKCWSGSTWSCCSDQSSVGLLGPLQHSFSPLLESAQGISHFAFFTAVSFTKPIPPPFPLAIHTSSLQLSLSSLYNTVHLKENSSTSLISLFLFFANTEGFDRAFDDPSLPETLYEQFQTWIQTSCSLQGYLEWCFNRNVKNTSYPSYKWGLAYPGSSLCSPAHFFRGLPPLRASCSSLHIPSSPTAISLFFCWISLWH